MTRSSTDRGWLQHNIVSGELLRPIGLAQYLRALLAVTKVNIGLEIQTFAHCHGKICSLFNDLPIHSHCVLTFCVVLHWVMPAWQHQLARDCNYQGTLGTAAKELALG